MAPANARYAVAAVAVLAITIIAGTVAASCQIGPQRSGFARAFAVFPPDTISVGYTDWSQIAGVVGTDSATSEGRAAFDSRARERDLSTRSVLAGASDQLYDAFGWSLSDLDWEAYGQSRSGNVVVVGLGSDLAASTVVTSLRKAGYEHASGVWQAQSDTFRRKNPDIPTELNNVVVLDRRTLLVGAQPDYLRSVQNAAKTLAEDRQMRQAANQVSGTATALVQDGPLGCDRAGFDDADDDTAAAAEAAVATHGRLRDYGAVARAIDVDGARQSMRFAMTFDSAAVASEQLGVRRANARGPWVGRSGDVEDSLRLRSARSDANTVTMTFDHDVAKSAYMDAVGPVLFASCSH